MSRFFSATLRRRFLLLAGLILTLWASWQVSQDDTPDNTVPARTTLTARADRRAPVAAVPVFKLEWPERSHADVPVADLFNPPAPPLAPTAIVATPPALPMLTLRYVGRLDSTDNRHVFLVDAQDRVISAEQGDTLADGWQLTAVDDAQLVFRHTASGQQHNILTGAIQ